MRGRAGVVLPAPVPRSAPTMNEAPIALAEPPVPGLDPDPAAALARLLELRRGQRHVVAIQDYPDPDAISSALAYREMARGFEIEADILYAGQISHPENLALVNLLGIDLARYRDEDALDGYDAAVFVDNQGATTRLAEPLSLARVPTLAVVDHHDPVTRLQPEWTDIRPVGACATLFAEYLRSERFVRLERGNPRHTQLATALMHGLHSETDRLVRAGEAEYAAADFLRPFMDPDLLERVMCIQKSFATMEAIRAALSHRTVRGGLSVAGVGYLREADRDAIPQAADFLLDEENVQTVIVYGIVRGEGGRESVNGSLRTRKAAFSVDAFLKAALGSDVRGHPYGGGRSRAGGFEIDVGFLAGDHDEQGAEMRWTLFDRQLRTKLFRAAGVEPATGDSDDDSEATGA